MPLQKHVVSFLNTVVAFVLVCALSWPALTNLRHAFTEAHRFHLTGDEALHSEIVENLAQTGLYQQWNGPAFAPVLTTGPTLIVPAAVLSRVSGMSGSASARSVVVIYHLLALGIVGWVCAREFRLKFPSGVKAGLPSWAVALMAMGIFELGWRGLQDTGYYTFGVMGEGPSVFWTLLCFALGLRGKLFGAGAAASLALLSKPYLFFLPPSLLISVWVQTPRGMRGVAIARVLAGLAFPWFFWMGWMVARLGFGGAIDFWIQYPKIMRSVNGAALPASDVVGVGGWFSLVLLHFKSLPVLAKWRSLLMVLLGVVGTLIFRRADSFEKKANPSAFAPVWIVFIFLHLGWWIALSPSVQARYLLPPFVAGWFAFSLDVFTRAISALDRKLVAIQAPRVSHVVLGLGVFIVLTQFVGQIRASWREDQDRSDQCGLCKQVTLQNYWKSVEEKTLLWSTKQDYALDKDLVLTAPYSMGTWDFEKAPVPREGWVVIGESVQPRAVEILIREGCQKVYVFPGTDEGFWSCGSK